MLLDVHVRPILEPLAFALITVSAVRQKPQQRARTNHPEDISIPDKPPYLSQSLFSGYLFRWPLSPTLLSLDKEACEAP